MQAVSGAEAARDREDGAGLTGDNNRGIHTKERVLYTKDGSVHEYNKYGVGPSVDFHNSGLICLENRNGAAAVEGTNQNKSEGAAFAMVVDSSLENFGTGNQRTAPWIICSEIIVHLTSLYSIFLNKALHPMK